jgi:hypothetical protein
MPKKNATRDAAIRFSDHVKIARLRLLDSQANPDDAEKGKAFSDALQGTREGLAEYFGRGIVNSARGRSNYDFSTAIRPKAASAASHLGSIADPEVSSGQRRILALEAAEPYVGHGKKSPRELLFAADFHQVCRLVDSAISNGHSVFADPRIDDVSEFKGRSEDIGNEIKRLQERTVGVEGVDRNFDQDVLAFTKTLDRFIAAEKAVGQGAAPEAAGATALLRRQQEQIGLAKLQMTQNTHSLMKHGRGVLDVSHGGSSSYNDHWNAQEANPGSMMENPIPPLEPSGRVHRLGGPRTLLAKGPVISSEPVGMVGRLGINQRARTTRPSEHANIQSASSIADLNPDGATGLGIILPLPPEQGSKRQREQNHAEERPSKRLPSELVPTGSNTIDGLAAEAKAMYTNHLLKLTMDSLGPPPAQSRFSEQNARNDILNRSAGRDRSDGRSK